ncbi:hypothetical protein MRB53_014484 [Persea americana]|uniref:Uncharacterized protein n=1 Tax=Persea americana TaxID=3435 RepID=A0ACC2KBL7_PERAE|nr:hypothetical protein MRB53_014484 [Persea americana]
MATAKNHYGADELKAASSRGGSKSRAHCVNQAVEVGKDEGLYLESSFLWLPYSAPQHSSVEAKQGELSAPTASAAANGAVVAARTHIVEPVARANATWGFYTYEDFIAAAKKFEGFAQGDDSEICKREIAAFLGQTSHETTGSCLRRTGLIRDCLLVLDDPTITQPKPPITGNWTPTPADIAAGRLPGYGVTTNIINGGLECGIGPDPRVADRIGF